MVDLPIEVWHSIFDHLQLSDLSSSALVSKALYFLVKKYRIQGIAFTCRVHGWFHHTTPIIHHPHRVDFMKASILRGSSFFNIYCLKRLKIGRFSGILDLDVIKRFVNLQELDIEVNFRKKGKRTLSLAKLQVLYVAITGRTLSLKLDTPRLTKMCTNSLARFEFIYPESVRCIHTSYHHGKLSMFRNLEVLHFTDHYNQMRGTFSSWPFEEFRLTGIEKLKEIEFYYFNESFAKENLITFKRMIRNLLARPDLKVFWFNVRVTNINLLTEYDHMTIDGSSVVFYLRYYEKLKHKVEYPGDFEFNESMRKLTEAELEFPPRSEEFISKFLASCSLRKMKITGQVVEPGVLMELIGRSSKLFSLKFSNSGLGQKFFDRMAEIIQLNRIPLQFLRHFEHSSNTQNFEFLLKLRHLELFKTDHRLSNELVTKLLEMPMLTNLMYSHNFKIERLSENRFYLNRLDRLFSLSGVKSYFSVSQAARRETNGCGLM